MLEKGVIIRAHQLAKEVLYSQLGGYTPEHTREVRRFLSKVWQMPIETPIIIASSPSGHICEICPRGFLPEKPFEDYVRVADTNAQIPCPAESMKKRDQLVTVAMEQVLEKPSSTFTVGDFLNEKTWNREKRRIEESLLANL